eukprot:365224-Chlamydomonas_euryale.AAC.21
MRSITSCERALVKRVHAGAGRAVDKNVHAGVGQAVGTNVTRRTRRARTVRCPACSHRQPLPPLPPPLLIACSCAHVPAFAPRSVAAAAAAGAAPSGCIQPGVSSHLRNGGAGSTTAHSVIPSGHRPVAPPAAAGVAAAMAPAFTRPLGRPPCNPVPPALSHNPCARGTLRPTALPQTRPRMLVPALRFHHPACLFLPSGSTTPHACPCPPITPVCMLAPALLFLHPACLPLPSCSSTTAASPRCVRWLARRATLQPTTCAFTHGRLRTRTGQSAGARSTRGNARCRALRPWWQVRTKMSVGVGSENARGALGGGARCRASHPCAPLRGSVVCRLDRIGSFACETFRAPVVWRVLIMHQPCCADTLWRSHLVARTQCCAHVLEHLCPVVLTPHCAHALLRARSVAPAPHCAHALLRARSVAPAPCCTHALLHPRPVGGTLCCTRALLGARSLAPAPCWGHALLHPRPVARTPCCGHGLLHPRPVARTPCRTLVMLHARHVGCTACSADALLVASAAAVVQFQTLVDGFAGDNERERWRQLRARIEVVPEAGLAPAPQQQQHQQWCEERQGGDRMGGTDTMTARVAALQQMSSICGVASVVLRLWCFNGDVAAHQGGWGLIQVPEGWIPFGQRMNLVPPSLVAMQRGALGPLEEPSEGRGGSRAPRGAIRGWGGSRASRGAMKGLGGLQGLQRSHEGVGGKWHPVFLPRREVDPCALSACSAGHGLAAERAWAQGRALGPHVSCDTSIATSHPCSPSIAGHGLAAERVWARGRAPGGHAHCQRKRSAQRGTPGRTPGCVAAPAGVAERAVASLWVRRLLVSLHLLAVAPLLERCPFALLHWPA